MERVISQCKVAEYDCALRKTFKNAILGKNEPLTFHSLCVDSLNINNYLAGAWWNHVGDWPVKPAVERAKVALLRQPVQ